MSGFSFGLVSLLLKNRFQFCLHAALVSGFQFRFKFHPRKLFCAQMTAQMAEWHRASVSWAVDSSLIPSRVKPMTIKLVFTASLLDTQHWRDSVKNKPARLLVVPLGKALTGFPHLWSWCGRVMAGPLLWKSHYRNRKRLRNYDFSNFGSQNFLWNRHFDYLNPLLLGVFVLLRW